MKVRVRVRVRVRVTTFRREHFQYLYQKTPLDERQDELTQGRDKPSQDTKER